LAIIVLMTFSAAMKTAWAFLWLGWFCSSWVPRRPCPFFAVQQQCGAARFLFRLLGPCNSFCATGVLLCVLNPGPCRSKGEILSEIRRLQEEMEQIDQRVMGASSNRLGLANLGASESGLGGGGGAEPGSAPAVGLAASSSGNNSSSSSALNGLWASAGELKSRGAAQAAGAVDGGSGLRVVVPPVSLDVSSKDA
jgi:hypothetical protein